MKQAAALPNYASWIGYTDLQSILGGGTPDGSGLTVQLVEGLEVNARYIPNPSLFNGTYVNVTLNAGVTQGSAVAPFIYTVF